MTIHTDADDIDDTLHPVTGVDLLPAYELGEDYEDVGNHWLASQPKSIELGFDLLATDMQVFATQMHIWLHRWLEGRAKTTLGIPSDLEVMVYERKPESPYTDEDVEPRIELRISWAFYDSIQFFLIGRGLDKPLDNCFFSLSIWTYQTDRIRVHVSDYTESGKITNDWWGWLRYAYGGAIRKLERGPDLAEFIADDAQELTRELLASARGAGGRPRDPWNQRAVDRLLAGEDRNIVRADWCADYEAEINVHPRATEDGEERTWQRRVWEPYQRAKRAK
jgi:NADH:ubiquinone oxidoreductase subunit